MMKGRVPFPSRSRRHKEAPFSIESEPRHLGCYWGSKVPCGFLLSLVLLGSVVLGTAAEPAQPTVELKGILNAPKRQAAVLEIREQTGRPPVSQILQQGDRIEAIEVLKIEPKAGQVVLRIAGKEQTLALPRDAAAADDPKLPPRTLELHAVPVAQVLEIYQTLCGRTVLPAPSMASFPLTVRTGAGAPVAETLKVLEASLANSGLIVKPHGDKFVLAVPAKQATRMEKLPPSPAGIPAGESTASSNLKFRDADLIQVTEIYQELTGRTVLRPGTPPPLRITAQAESDLTRLEVVHMLEVLLTLGGLAAVPDGDKFVFVLPSSETGRIPKIAVRRSALAKNEGDDWGQVLPAASIRFIDARLGQVLQAYGDIAGRQVLPLEANVPALRLTLKVQSGLARREAVYALEAVLALNHIELVPAGDRDVKAVFVPPTKLNEPLHRAR